ncbi:MAG TPA: Hsp20/alpha crystallin family protein [Nitrospira sp.]|nr:Hsp20/alpha crystallin family protein [Nitrospira sp.]
MPLMTKLKEIMPWKRKPVETHEVMSLRDDINQLFDRLLMSPFDTRWPSFGSAGPGVELDETNEHVIVRAEVPGLDPKHLQVEVRNGMLHVSYEHEAEWRANNGEASGRRYAAFHRTVALPEGVDDERAEATCKHGVLTIRIPWRREAIQRSHRLTVSVE